MFCVKTFCDRVDPNAMVTQTVSVDLGINGIRVLNLAYFATDDYFATCCVISAPICDFKQRPWTPVDITLQDANEWTIIKDIIRIKK